MQFRDDCNYVKSPDEEANPGGAEGESDKPRTSVSSSNDMGSNWLGAEQQLPTRDRSAGHSPVFPMQGVSYSHAGGNPILSSTSGTLSGFGQSENGETNDTSTSPDGPSNRPTPNSSAASDQRQGGGSSAGGLAPGRINNASEGNSFAASPVSPHQNITSQAEMERNVSAFFGDPTNGFTMSTGLTPMMTGETPGNEFAVPAGWEMQGQTTGMTPVSEGVLRTIMQMGPMETMDLGWAANQ